MQLNLWLRLRLLAGCLAQSLRHSDNPSFATNMYCKPTEKRLHTIDHHVEQTRYEVSTLYAC